MKKKWISLLLFSLISVCSVAQTGGYKFYCRLDSVKTSGFYNIEIGPEINARLKTDYSDLRIVNAAGKWVPHILHTSAQEQSNELLVMDSKFSIVENTAAKTVLIAESRQSISSNIGLVITNTAAERFCTLSGTHDKQNWFVINDSILINPVPAENATENFFRIDFPSNNYRFHKMVIRNNGKDPFNIKSVVEYITSASITNPLYKLNKNPATSIQQQDSGKISYIKITQALPYHFDNISLQLSGVKYYNRKVDVYIPLNDLHSYENPGQLLQTFTISNNSTLQYKIPLTKAHVFYLLIRNEDNLPLVVNEVKTACSNHYLTAYLDAENRFKLIMDNEAAVMPDYDLSQLNNNIPDSIAVLQYGSITAAEETMATTAPLKNNNWMLWSAIAAALLILLFFTYKMLKEVDKRKMT